MTPAALQAAGLRILSNDSPILDVARQVSSLIREHELDAAVIGGVAVVLHGHVRTTLDVDVYSEDSDALHKVLERAGLAWDAQAKQFTCQGVPVQIVTPAQVPQPPREREDLSDIRTVGLADLLNMKLRSGTASVLRSQDLADVIGLMRANALTGRFTPRIHKDLRPTFRQLLCALREEHGR